MKVLFEKLLKKNEIDEKRANRDNRSRTKRKSESKKTRHSRKSKKQTKHQRKSKKKTTSKRVEKKTTSERVEEKTTSKRVEKKTTSDDFEIENLTKSKAEFRFLLLTERRKDTNIETLKRLTIIVTVLTRSYLSTNNITEIIDESNKAERRALTQVSETYTKLTKYRKILSLVRNFHSHDRESDSNDLDFLFQKFNENL